MRNNQSQSQKVVVATTAAVVVGMSCLYYVNKKLKEKKFPVPYKHPEWPLPLRIITNLPAFIRKSMFLKMAAPKPPLDGIDLLGSDYNPYDIHELEPNKLWRVRYRFMNDPALEGAMKVIFGVDLFDKSTILNKIQDDNIRKHVEIQLNRLIEMKTKNKDLPLEEKQRNRLNAGMEDSHDMLVAKLKDGSLLLYNPCRMHPYIVEDFLQKKLGGNVQFLVSGSSSHTNQLPQAAQIFPNAKIICADSANRKCIAVGMRSADYIYTNHTDGMDNGFEAAANILQPLGVQMFHVQGDALVQALIIIVHEHLFVVDLLYGNGSRWMHTDENDWNTNSPPSLAFVQSFYYAGIQDAEIGGYLPTYRLMGMDPTSYFPKIQVDEPPTSNSCEDMAKSLRQLVKLPFRYVDDVHSKRKDSIPASEFIDCVENSWNWLDGQTLLAEKI